MLRRGLVVSLSAAALVVATRSASAQTIGAITSSVVRRSRVTRTTSTNAISRADCEAGDAFTFPLTLSYTSGWTFQVWVSQNADCTDKGARGLTSGIAAQCGLVVSRGNMPVTSSLAISDAEILSAIRAPSPDIDPAPTCATPPNAGVGLQSVTMYFMFVSDGGTKVAGTQVVNFIQYATTGPAAPAGVTAGAGDQMLKVRWAQNTDSTVSGYFVFCDPPPGQEPVLAAPLSTDDLGTARSAQVAADAGDDANVTLGTEAGVEEASLAVDGGPDNEGGAASEARLDASVDVSSGTGSSAGTTEANTSPSAADDGGQAGSSSDATTDATSTSGSCGSSLVAGRKADQLLSTHRCGTVSGYSTTSVNVKGLRNYSTYSVAVASFDLLGNVGVLSTPYCVANDTTPRPVYGFYERYVEAEGTALGGTSFCSVPGVGLNRRGASLAGAAMVAMAFALGVARRAKRRR